MLFYSTAKAVINGVESFSPPPLQKRRKNSHVKQSCYTIFVSLPSDSVCFITCCFHTRNLQCCGIVLTSWLGYNTPTTKKVLFWLGVRTAIGRCCLQVSLKTNKADGFAIDAARFHVNVSLMCRLGFNLLFFLLQTHKIKVVEEYNRCPFKLYMHLFMPMLKNYKCVIH